jgi:hypothetical protein
VQRPCRSSGIPIIQSIQRGNNSRPDARSGIPNTHGEIGSGNLTGKSNGGQSDAPRSFTIGVKSSLDSAIRLDPIAAHLLPQRRSRNLQPLRRRADVASCFSENSLDLPLLGRITRR